MVGYNFSYFRRHYHDFPQDTQLSRRDLPHRHWHISSYHPLQRVKMPLVVPGIRKEGRRMGVQDKSIEHHALKRWYWPALILGLVMVVGGILWVVIR